MPPFRWSFTLVTVLLAMGMAWKMNGTTRYVLSQDDLEPTVTKDPDVVYVPTPHDVVAKMLELAAPAEGETVYDLGCGDGRIVVAAARDYGAFGVGVDIDPQRISESRDHAILKGVDHRVKIVQDDIFTMDFADADVVMLYLEPQLNLRLLPQLQNLPPGTRVISHQFDMAGYEADEVVEMVSTSGTKHTIYCWRTPFRHCTPLPE